MHGCSIGATIKIWVTAKTIGATAKIGAKVKIGVTVKIWVSDSKNLGAGRLLVVRDVGERGRVRCGLLLVARVLQVAPAPLV